MKVTPYLKLTSYFIAGAALILFIINGCQNQQSSSDAMSHDQMVERGKYLVKSMGCGDCHSPKVMTNMGPVEDTTRLLSGHPANEPALIVALADTQLVHTGQKVLINGDFTAWIGPWGESFTANLTPDMKTGIGNWDSAAFIRTIRLGKYQGIASGRDLLPPMPWQEFNNLTDQDLTAIFDYLQTLPAISNQVPPPIPPGEVAIAK
jgi:Cytochrome c